MLISSQDLETISFQKPIDLLDKTFQWDGQSPQRPGWSGVSDNSSTDSECTDVEASSVASDLDRFDTAYNAFRDLANGLYHIDLRRYSRGVTSEDAAGVLLVDGYEKLQELVHLPRTWWTMGKASISFHRKNRLSLGA